MPQTSTVPRSVVPYRSPIRYASSRAYLFTFAIRTVHHGRLNRSGEFLDRMSEWHQWVNGTNVGWHQLTPRHDSCRLSPKGVAGMNAASHARAFFVPVLAAGLVLLTPKVAFSQANTAT